MKYTKVPKEVKLELSRLKKEPFDLIKCIEHPSYFAHHVLGITPYSYQHMLLRKFANGYKEKNDRIIFVKPRQIGMSVCVGILAIWYAAYCKANNGAGTGIHKDTKVNIVSKDDNAATKLMAEIKNMIWNAKFDLKKLVKKEQGIALSKRELHFEKGVIKCFPPTGAIRGNTSDILIIDEAAFVDINNTNHFKDAMEPTVTAVGGKIILSSTPRGQKGYFFELFDPMDLIKGEHEYERFWFHWQMCENSIQKKIIMDKQKHSKKTGNTKSFDQEYRALFTVDEEAFFEDYDVEKGVDKSLVEVYEWQDSPCSLGIDYGGSNAATTLTVTTKVDNKIKLIFQYGKINLDENLLMDINWEHSIQKLMKRYAIQDIIVDNCPQGTRTNQQLVNEGYPVTKFNFMSDAHTAERNRGYFLFRAALKNGTIRYPEIKSLMGEMKTLQETRMTAYMKIKAPQNYPDDRIDGFMMSCYPFLVEDGSFDSSLVDYSEVEKEINSEQQNPRCDNEWDKLKHKENPYDFLMKEAKNNGDGK